MHPKISINPQLRAGDAALVATDMVKDESIRAGAYDDGGGVTAAFNLDILPRLNRELGADCDLNNFGHRAVWNRVASRIEMHLESTRDHQVCVACAAIKLHFDVERTWMDDRSWFAVTLARISKNDTNTKPQNRLIRRLSGT